MGVHIASAPSNCGPGVPHVVITIDRVQHRRALDLDGMQQCLVLILETICVELNMSRDSIGAVFAYRSVLCLRSVTIPFVFAFIPDAFM